jgi:hypothetical protein
MVGLDERHERLPREVLRHAPRGERRVAGFGRLEDRRMVALAETHETGQVAGVLAYEDPGTWRSQDVETDAGLIDASPPDRPPTKTRRLDVRTTRHKGGEPPAISSNAW